MDREDGEMTDDDAMFVDEEKVAPAPKSPNVALIYKADKNGLIVDKLEKVDASKIEERAKRFGLNLTGNKVITQNQIDELYQNMGIVSGVERHFRFDTLHLSGVDGLSTKEIFEYLEDYKPISLEWVDINTCNVVCQDHISAALALLVHSREINDAQIKEMISTSSKHHWREGMPHYKKDYIFMRFATNSDKVVKNPKSNFVKPTRVQDDELMEPVSKNPWGHLSQSWGVYDHQEVWNRPLSDNEYDIIHDKTIKVRNKQLASRLGKRPKSEDSDSSSSTEWRKQSKAPRMRMRADEEEDKRRKRQQTTVPHVKVKQDEIDLAPLSIEVVNANTPYAPKETRKLSDRFKTHKSQPQTKAKQGIHSRLGAKMQEIEIDDYSSDESSTKSEYNVMSRVQRVNKNRSNSASDVWSRLEQDNDSSNDLRSKLKSRITKKNNDLRDRLGKPNHGMSLRIEVDNDYRNSE